MNPGPPPILQLSQQPQLQPAPRRRKKLQNPYVIPWILQRQEKAGCYSNLLVDRIHRDISGYQNFVRMPPAFLPYQRMHTPSHEEVRNLLEVALKQEATGNWTQTGHNSETSGHWKDLNFFAVSLAGRPHHHLQICPLGMPSHP